MTSSPAAGTDRSGLRRWLAVWRWPVWAVPARLLMSLLVVEATAVVLLVTAFVELGAGVLQEWRTGALICLLGAVHTEIARDVERVRRRIVEGNFHVNLGSVWYFAAAVLLHPALSGICVILLTTHMWWRSAGPRSPIHRQLFTTANIVLACFAATAAMTYVIGAAGPVDRFDSVSIWALVVGMLVFTTVNTALVGGVIAASAPRTKIGDIVGEWDENLLELATLCLGALVAAALTVNPWLAILALPPLLVLHRAVLVRHLEQAASTDGKTGLLNAAAWHSQAERELRRAQRRHGPRAVLVIDLDHFKAVNDTHGHLAGDDVLAAVADALRAEVRDHDLVGRFGGEEFVVLLGGLEGAGQGSLELTAVAERIRLRVAALQVEIPTPDGPLTIAGLSASVGGALYPADGNDLHTLLQVADAALYSAKRAGRNRVRMGLQRPVPPLVVPVGSEPADPS